MIAAGEREPERQAERAARGVDAGGLADALLLDRGQRVVVELRHEQAETGARDQQRDGEGPARSRARGTIGMQIGDADGQQQRTRAG